MVGLGSERESFLHSAVPFAEPLIDAQAVASYSRDLKEPITAQRWKELRVAGGTLLASIAEQIPTDPEHAAWKAIARNCGLERTPHDSAKGPAVNIFTDPELRQALLAGYARHLRYMEMLTHPTVLNSRIALLQSGTVPDRLQRTNDYLEALLNPEIRRAISWDDIGWGLPERRPGVEEGDESTTAIHAQGFWSHIGRHVSGPRIGLPILGCSHPDLMTPLAVAEHAIIGGDSFIPCDGPWGRLNGAGLKAKIEFALATREIIEHHPLILVHSHANVVLNDNRRLVQHIIDGALDRFGATLKPHPPSVIGDEAKALKEAAGVKLFRIFDPRDTSSLPHAIEAVRAKAGSDVFIYASQVTGINSARACLAAGANAVIMNIGDGESCTTSSGTGQMPSNLLTFYRVQRDLDPSMGIIVDGGVGQKVGLALGLGATGAMKHGSLFGTTLHHGPLLTAIRDPESGKICFLQSGEAARRTKYRSGSQVDGAGLERNVEGVDRHREWDPSSGYLPGFAEHLVKRFLEPLGKQLAFCEANHLAQFMQWATPPFWEGTLQAAMRSGAHFGER